MILFLRGFKKEAEAKRPLFSLKQIAEAVPDFKGRSRQSVQDHERRFKESGEDLQKYLNRKRKVEGEVVHAVIEELKEDCLGTKTELAKRVNQRLGRDDLSNANIEAALEQISAKIFRVFTQGETGIAPIEKIIPHTDLVMNSVMEMSFRQTK